MEECNQLMITKRPNLTCGQKVLFNLICKKIENNTKLLFDESKSMYINYGNRNVQNGIPYYYDYYAYQDAKTKEWRGAYKPMTEEMIKQMVLIWLTRNIGSLVLKGYLKVLPVLELQ